jgi:hypothetical protein
MLGGYFVYKIDSFYLENHLMYSEDSAEGFSIIAADDLDTIVNKLEAYKEMEGIYPEKLELLKKAYPEIRITDPLLERNPKIHKFLGYYYKQNGSGYILFSSGKDGIPNTSDDIYPRHTLKPSN